jgi:hypothetical protein
MIEVVRCKLVELLGVVGSKGKSSMVVDVKFDIITNLESRWRLLRKWLKIGEIEVCWSCQNRSTIFGPELALPIRKKSKHDLEKLEYNFAQKNKNKKYFYGPDLVPIYEGCFYYKYRHCIGVNLKIEGAETRV